RLGRGSGAGQGMAARLLEASAAAVVDGRPALSPDRPARCDLCAGPARGGGLLLCGLAIGARGHERAACLDRRARARSYPFLQFLGGEVRARPDAAAVLGVHRLVLLSRPRARPAALLGACPRLPVASVLVLLFRLCASPRPAPD